MDLTKSWCINMAEQENGNEIGAGMPDHPLHALQVIHDALMDSQYLAGINAGWNAAQSDDPESALAAARKSREGHLAGFKEAKNILSGGNK